MRFTWRPYSDDPNGGTGAGDIYDNQEKECVAHCVHEEMGAPIIKFLNRRYAALTKSRES